MGLRRAMVLMAPVTGGYNCRHFDFFWTTVIAAKMLNGFDGRPR